MAQPYPYTPPPAAGPGMPPIPPTRPSSNTWIIVLAVGTLLGQRRERRLNQAT